MLETIAGRGLSPSLVQLHVLRLPDTSLTRALMAGGRDHFEWGQDRHLLADIYDAISTLTKVVRDWKKPPEIPAWPRPGSAAAEPPKRVTVKDLWARFQGLPHAKPN